ncbi:MAG TPA: hypothetical protein VGL13_15700, partial [Polyangiaceae bacterium]
MTEAEREFHGLCPGSDGALARVAALIADGRIGTNTNEVVNALRREGAPYVWPRAWSLSGRGADRKSAEPRLRAWLAAFRGASHLRCGFASTEAQGATSYAAVAVDAPADLYALPRRAKQGAWLDFAARVSVPATSAQLVVAPPSGAPFNVPTSLDGERARARLHLDRAGVWRLSLVIDEDS